MPVTVERALFQQIAKQASFDSPVAATFRYLGDLTFTENIDYFIQPGSQRVRGPVSGQMVNVHNGWIGKYSSEATYEEILTALQSTLQGAVAGSAAASAITYVFTPPVAGDPAPNYLTVEYALNDWTTSYGRQVPNVLGSQLQVQLPINAPARMIWDMFGGKVVVATPTASLTNVTGREVAKGNLTKVYIDAAGSGLGGTLKSGSVLNADITLSGGLRPDYTLEGRTGLDYGKYLFGDVMGSIKLLMEYNADANTEVVAWRAATKRFVRVIVTGSTLSAAVKTIQFDLCVEWDKAVVIGHQNGNDIVTLEGTLRYDATWAKIAIVTLITGLATFT